MTQSKDERHAESNYGPYDYRTGQAADKRRQREEDARRKTQEQNDQARWDAQHAMTKNTNSNKPAGTTPAKNSCFPYSARVFTPTGSKPIGTIEQGSSVLSFDVANGQLSLCTVTRRIDHKPSPVLAVHTVGCTKPLLVTPTHPLLTPSGWVEARRLREADQLCMVTGDSQELVQVCAVIESAQMESLHNLHTTNAHNFVVEGFVAHNFVYFREVRSIWHRWFVDARAKQSALSHGLGVQ